MKKKIAKVVKVAPKPLPKFKFKKKKTLTIGSERLKTEDTETFIKRMIRKYGFRPIDIFSSPRVLKEAKIDPKEYTHQQIVDLTKRTFALAQIWMAEHNERYRKGKVNYSVSVDMNGWYEGLNKDRFQVMRELNRAKKLPEVDFDDGPLLDLDDGPLLDLE